MSGSTGAMLLLGVFLLAVTVFASVYRVVSLGLASTVVSVGSGHGDLLRTRISITSTDIDFITTGEGRCATYSLAIDSYVGNTGKTAIQKYEDMDVVLHYSPEGGGNTAVHPSYSEDSVSEGEWTVLAINPNTFASTTWNPAETATIRLRPSVAAEPRTRAR